jgi:hypothetical protein
MNHASFTITIAAAWSIFIRLLFIFVERGFLNSSHPHQRQLQQVVNRFLQSLRS